MGRVSRFKKIKQCDPFAKKRPVVIDPKYDQPPKHDEIDDDECFGDGVEEFDGDWKSPEVKQMVESKKPMRIDDTKPPTKPAQANGDGKPTKSALKRARRKERAAIGALVGGGTTAQREFEQDLRTSRFIQRVSRDTSTKKAHTHTTYQFTPMLT